MLVEFRFLRLFLCERIHELFSQRHSTWFFAPQSFLKVGL